MPPQIWEVVTAECDGKTIKGSYRKIGNMVTVKTLHGSKTTQLGGLTPDYLAKMLLRELARKGKA
jgi:hypothetical protein